MRILISLILTALICTTYGYEGTLSFKPTSSPDIFTFIIIQITDTHLGDHWDQNDLIDYTNDPKTYAAMDAILLNEKPDLILLTGDQLHSDHIIDNATVYYDILGAFMESHSTPWGLIFGNHDDAASNAFPDEPARTDRREYVIIYFVLILIRNYLFCEPIGTPHPRIGIHTTEQGNDDRG